MLITISNPEELDGERLMGIYRESNEENAEDQYPDLDGTEAVEKIRRGFVEFIKKDFLNGANRYFVWEEDGVWVSALRLYFVREGFYYIEALETHPDYRRRGYGARVLSETLKVLEKTGPFEVHDCVSRTNEASLATHRKCGFVIDSDVGVNYLSGKRNERAYGMRCDSK